VTRSNRPKFGALIFFAAAFALSGHFTFAAVQGDFGLFRRVEVTAEAEILSRELERMQAEIAVIENLTRRLSDDYLDLDLLDQQARSVLGLLRADEIVIR
jgi:cell division protein FtsB